MLCQKQTMQGESKSTRPAQKLLTMSSRLNLRRLGSGWGSRKRIEEVCDSALEVDLKVALTVMRWLQGAWTEMPQSDKKELHKAMSLFPPQMASGEHWQRMMKMWLWKRSRTWNTMQKNQNSEGKEEWLKVLKTKQWRKPSCAFRSYHHWVNS